MTHFLEFKEKMKRIYSRYDTYIVALFKFAMMFVAVIGMNRQTGYLNNPYPVALVCAGLSAIFPQGMMAFVFCTYLLMPLLSMSFEAGLVLGLLLLVMFCAYYAFKPGDSYLMVLATLLTCWKMPGILIVVAGMFFSPFAVIPIGFGIVLGTYMNFVQGNLTALASSTTTLSEIQKIVLLTNGVIKDQTMFLCILTAIITICMAYVIRKLSVTYAWTIAAVTGAVVNVVVMIVGGSLLGIETDLVATLLASVIGLVITLLCYFFVYSLDYSRVESVQFEDEEYYYYVKAVPKMTVTKTQVHITTISERVDRTGEFETVNLDEAAVRRGMEGGNTAGKVSAGTTAIDAEEVKAAAQSAENAEQDIIRVEKVSEERITASAGDELNSEDLFEITDIEDIE